MIGDPLTGASGEGERLDKGGVERLTIVEGEALGSGDGERLVRGDGDRLIALRYCTVR